MAEPTVTRWRRQVGEFVLTREWNRLSWTVMNGYCPHCNSRRVSNFKCMGTHCKTPLAEFVKG